MDGNNAKKAPTLENLVASKRASANAVHAQNANVTKIPQPKSGTGTSKGMGEQKAQDADVPRNRRTDKSEFEIQLAGIVNKILVKHFSDASEEIVHQVLQEVRARLPGRK